MHPGSIQRILSVRNSQEARALLKSLRPKLGHLEKILAGHKPPVLLTISHNILGRSLRNPRNILKQRSRCRVQIDANLVHAVLHHAIQRLAQLLLVHIMLILPHTDRLGIDLDQLGQRILQPSRDGSRTPLPHVKVREFLRGKLARGIDRSTRLIGDHILHFLGDLLQKLHDDLLRLT